MAQDAVIVMENDHVRYEVGADARSLAFVDKRTGTNHIASPTAAYRIQLDSGDQVDATAVRPDGDGYRIAFGDSGVSAKLRYRSEDAYLAVEVAAVTGEPKTLTFLSILLEEDASDFVATPLALNLQTQVHTVPQPTTGLVAIAHNKFGLEGSGAAIVACPNADLREALQSVIRSEESLPESPLGGPFAMDHPITRGSYLMDTRASITEESVEDWIAMMNAMGITQLDFHTGINMRFGDYEPNPEMFPRGMESVRAVTDKLAEAGILSGLHTYAFFIAKDTPWVTPVPHPDILIARTFTLAEDVSPDATEIVLEESTADMSTEHGFLVNNSLTVRIGDELINFSGFTKEPPYKLTGLERGAFGTVVSAHEAGAEVGHLQEMFGLFLPDPNSELFMEVIEKTAEAYNEGGFDMMYLDAIDGAFLLDEREDHWYYSGKFVWELAQRLDEPALMEMSMFNHHLWFLRSRIGAWDVPTRGLKSFIDMHTLYNDTYDRCFLPSHLGWWGVRQWSGQDQERTFPDVMEYLLAKCIANDSGMSQIVGFDQNTYFESHNQQRLGELIRRYEHLRLRTIVPEDIRKKLAERGQDYTLADEGKDQWAFHPVNYIKHAITLHEDSRRWTVNNEYEAQPLQIRIQASLALDPWDATDARTLVDFSDPSIFSETRSREGVTSSIGPVPKNGDGSGIFTATHSEGNPQTSWTMQGTMLDPFVSQIYRGMGVWVNGDGKGEILNIQYKSPSLMEAAILDHYIKVDFTGPRYFELVKPEGETIPQYGWPYCPRREDWNSGDTSVFVGAYSTFHIHMERNKIRQVNLWYNNIPEGETVTTTLSPIRSLSLREITLRNPTVRVNGQPVTFTTDLPSGHYLEMDRTGHVMVYDAKGEPVSEFRIEGEIPPMKAGANTIEFKSGVDNNPHPRAEVTVITQGPGMGFGRR